MEVCRDKSLITTVLDHWSITWLPATVSFVYFTQFVLFFRSANISLNLLSDWLQSDLTHDISPASSIVLHLPLPSHNIEFPALFSFDFIVALCGKLRNTDPYATVTYSGKSEGTSAVAVCPDGFIQTGDGQYICKSTGKWTLVDQSPSFFCTRVNCGQPSPQDPFTTGTCFSTSYPNKCKLKCAVGYEADSDLVTACQADGTWATLPDPCNPIPTTTTVSPTTFTDVDALVPISHSTICYAKLDYESSLGLGGEGYANAVSNNATVFMMESFVSMITLEVFRFDCYLQCASTDTCIAVFISFTPEDLLCIGLSSTGGSTAYISTSESWSLSTFEFALGGF